jgi:HD-like signal output (HDOD) protein
MSLKKTGAAMEIADRIEKISGRIKSLPLVDKSVFDIVTRLNNPESNFKSIIEKMTPDLTTRFLTMANMACYGREVRSINYAVRVLGFREMKNILVSSILIEHLTKQMDLKNFSIEKFQIQAQFCAAVSRIMGEIMDYPSLEDLFTVSIVHNIGKLIIVLYLEDEYEEIRRLKLRNSISTREAELEVFGGTHSEIGAEVLERFNIPKDICDAVRYHDNPHRKIEDSDNYELEFIFRESTRIVATYKLPGEMNPMDLIGRLSDTIREASDAFREEKVSKIRSRGYSKIFTMLLNECAERVQADLGLILEARD